MRQAPGRLGERRGVSATPPPRTPPGKNPPPARSGDGRAEKPAHPAQRSAAQGKRLTAECAGVDRRTPPVCPPPGDFGEANPERKTAGGGADRSRGPNKETGSLTPRR